MSRVRFPSRLYIYLELLEDHSRVQDQVTHVNQPDPSDETQRNGPGQPVPEMYGKYDDPH